ncbi:MAG: hypothetical protein HDR31_01675 [Mycoplasma sp.]|nr:hypothetical protein [Mycoplasma sp.]
MENQKRNWEIANQRPRSKENSAEIIQYFQTSNKYLEEKNEKSITKVNDLESERDRLLEEFERNYNISFEEAKNAKENSWHFERDFNLDDFNKIEKIIDKINGEKFFFHQRNKLIKKNDEVIKDIENWYKNNTVR